MNRESFRKQKRKNPKYRESNDDDFSWEDKVETKKIRRKQNKKSKRENSTEDQW